MSSKLRSLGRRAGLLPLLFLLLLGNDLLAASPPSFPPPKPAGPLFKQRPFGPLPPPTQTPAPKHFDPDDDKPIPREWIIGGWVAAALLLAGILYGSARAWRSSNIFDQQYRFPTNDDPALRFGGPRCGGHMATIHGGDGRPSSLVGREA
jgi:hypothetical protein